MTEIILPILLCVFVVASIIIIIVLIAISFANKSLLCTKFYCFFFEHDDWLLYKKAKKQGIQHYLNGYHFSQFYEAWNKVKEEYGVVNNNFLKLDEENKNTFYTKFNKLKEKYYYKEYYETEKNIKDDDIVLSLNMYGERLCIDIGNSSKNILHWKPMIKDILTGCEIWANGKTDNIKRLLIDPKEVVSF